MNRTRSTRRRGSARRQPDAQNEPQDGPRDADYQHIILPWDSPKWELIKERLTPEIKSIADLDNRIVMLHSGKIHARILIDLFNKYFSDNTIRDQYSEADIIDKLIPLLRELILNGKKIFNGKVLRVLSEGSCNITMTRQQVAVLLACAWFGLFNFYGINHLSPGAVKLRNFSKFGLIDLFMSGNVHAFQCILRYFMRVNEYINGKNIAIKKLFESSVIIYHRRELLPQCVPNFARCDKPLCDVDVGGPIDAFPEHIFKVNFSTPYICENCFRDCNLNYEEIMFLMHLECFPATLLVSSLRDNDSLIILGAEKMSTLGGFGSNVRYDSHYNYDASTAHMPPTGRSSSGNENIIKSAIICIDASRAYDQRAQLIENFDRDLLKAYCGFSAFNFPDNTIMTGHWSSITFSGNTQLKFLQQLLAASICDKNIVYYITSRDFEEQIDEFIKFIRETDLLVGELYQMYRMLMERCIRGKVRLSELNIFDALMDMDEIPSID
jgi:hypothetical protein